MRARVRTQYRAVVADAQIHRGSWSEVALEIAFDQIEFTHRRIVSAGLQATRSRFDNSTADLTSIFSNTRARCTSTVRTLIFN